MPDMMTVPDRIREVRGWISENLDRETLNFPDEDAVWAHITTKWPLIPTDTAEKVLCSAMQPIFQISDAMAQRSNRVSAVIKAAGPVAGGSFNEWFVDLPAERQSILREDKWMLANAAFEAGKTYANRRPLDTSF